MNVESIEYNGIKYAEIIWADTRVEETAFLPSESSLAHRGVYRYDVSYWGRIGGLTIC
jgi:hypothetical protein